MKNETLTDALLREFLLGTVDDESRARIESLFLTDSEVREKVLVVEQDLIEDYLEENLTPVDRERFLSRYAQTPEQRIKLRITKSIKDLGIKEAASGQPVPARRSGWRRLFERPLFVVPIAVMIAVTIIVAVVWLNSRSGRQHSTIETELAQLNSPGSLREFPPQMVLLDLSAVTVRSGTASELKTSQNIRIVQFHLPWQRERHPTYQAELRRLGTDESYTIRDLHGEDDATGYGIRMRIPAHILRRGQYRILLSGITPNGIVATSEEYNFTVGD